MKRIDAIGLKQWRDEIMDDIGNIRPISHHRFDTRAYLDTIQSKLADGRAHV